MARIPTTTGIPTSPPFMRAYVFPHRMAQMVGVRTLRTQFRSLAWEMLYRHAGWQVAFNLQILDSGYWMHPRNGNVLAQAPRCCCSTRCVLDSPAAGGRADTPYAFKNALLRSWREGGGASGPRPVRLCFDLSPSSTTPTFPSVYSLVLNIYDPTTLCLDNSVFFSQPIPFLFSILTFLSVNQPGCAQRRGWFTN